MVSELLDSRSARVLLAINLLIGSGLCMVPLFGIHGIESAFALGLVLPILCALHVERLERATTGGTPARRRLVRAAGVAVLHWGFAAALLTFNTLRIRQCEALMGLTYMVLGPLLGCLLASTLAVVATSLAQRLLLRRALSVAAPVAGLLAFAYGFYATPAILAYGHFFGYFPGSFYDELVDFPYPLLWLRLCTLLLLLAVVLCAQLLFDSATRTRRSQGKRVVLLLGLLGLAALLQLKGPELGFSVSASHVRASLGTTVRSRRCTIFAPREYAERFRFARDCDVRVEQLEGFLGLHQPKPVVVYLFRSAQEKRALIGAAGTNIAKPWRNEVYVQLDSYPHPVLPHELAHVVLGQVGQGPFRVSGAWHGLWPNPGIVEGAAVAADFRPRSGLTPHQWAKAALENGRAPSLTQLFGNGFFSQQASLSYTVAGSFLRHIVDSRGRVALLRLYQSGDVEGSLGAPLADLERGYHTFLQTVELPDDAAALAKERFSGGSVLSAICPHRVADLERALSADLRSGDMASAVSQCDALLQVDPDNVHAAATRIIALSRDGHLAEAETQLELLSQAAPSALTAETRQAFADALVGSGQTERADQIYRELEGAPHTVATLRQLQVKRIALAGGPRERALLFDLLADRTGQEQDPAMAVHLTRELRSQRSDGLPHYLEARQLYFYSHYPEAAALLGDALGLGLPTPELHDECQRLYALCLVASGQLDTAAAIYRERLGSRSLASRGEAQDFLTRIRILRRHGARQDPEMPQ